jgi:hypothetical protein
MGAVVGGPAFSGKEKVPSLRITVKTAFQACDWQSAQPPSCSWVLLGGIRTLGPGPVDHVISPASSFPQEVNSWARSGNIEIGR